MGGGHGDTDPHRLAAPGPGSYDAVVPPSEGLRPIFFARLQATLANRYTLERELGAGGMRVYPAAISSTSATSP